MELKDRFLKYVSFDTQSDENSTTFPSTDKQLVLLNYLADEMRSLGMEDVTVDKYGYAMGTIPASKGYENAPVIGFISHVDTAPDMRNDTNNCANYNYCSYDTDSQAPQHRC